LPNWRVFIKTHVAAQKVDGKLVSDPKGKANALNRHFQSVYTHKTTTIINSKSPCPTLPSILPITVTVPGVLKILKRLDPSKSSALDNIGPRVLRELSSVVASLTVIFQQSLRDGIVPEDWRKANITSL